MDEVAILLTNGMLRTVNAKTAHGLIRGPSRYRIAAVVDASCDGEDAGAAVDGRPRGIPVVASVRGALEGPASDATVCVIGVATAGGTIPPELRADLLAAAGAGLTLVNGLHWLLADDSELARTAGQNGARIVDLRRPRPVRELRFWSGEIRALHTPRVAVLGTDCAVGKRTTCALVTAACSRRGLRAAMVYTGQTGWLSGVEHGFILDATPNDFVSGELERAVLTCARECDPDVIFIEGQASLRNPSGPCGAELLVSVGAVGTILQHAPSRREFDGHPGWAIPPLADELELVRLFGSAVWAVTLCEAGLSGDRAESVRARLEAELGVPVLRPLADGADALAAVVHARLGDRERGRGDRCGGTA